MTDPAAPSDSDRPGGPAGVGGPVGAPFTLFLTSRAISWSGNALTMVALPILLYRQTGSATLTGLLAVAESAPYLLLGLPVGAIVDRWDHTRTMVVTSVLSALLIATVPVAAIAGPPSPVLLLVVATGLAALFVFFDAASFGAIPALVGREHIGIATARMTTWSTLIGIAGPPVAGVAIAFVGAPALLVADAASYLVGALLLVAIRWPPRPARLDRSTALRHDIVTGLRHLWRVPVIRDLTLIGFGNSLAAGIASGLVVVVVARSLHYTATGWPLGLLNAAAAIGTLVAAQLIAPVQRRLRIGTITISALAIGAVALAGFALAGTLAAAMVALLVWQFGNSTVSLNGIIVRQSITPAEMQGRVNTTARMIAWGGQPFGGAIGGVLADAVDVRTALLVGSGVLAVTVIAARAGALRATDTLARTIVSHTKR